MVRYIRARSSEGKSPNDFLRKLYYKFYTKIFTNYQMELEKRVEGCGSVLDVGCGSDSPIKLFSRRPYSVGVDVFGPAISKSKRQKIHDKYYKMSVLGIGKKFKPGSFDCVIAADLIEHMTKEEGMKLLKMMERIAKKRVVVVTPNGFIEQGEHEGNPWQVHKSGWTVKDMESRGYEVIGVNGWKPLRGEHAELNFRPKYLWLVISDITQFFVRNRPEKAFEILCVKNKGAGK